MLRGEEEAARRGLRLAMGVGERCEEEEQDEEGEEGEEVEEARAARGSHRRRWSEFAFVRSILILVGVGSNILRNVQCTCKNTKNQDRASMRSGVMQMTMARL